jgi:hypothetical protein
VARNPIAVESQREPDLPAAVKEGVVDELGNDQLQVAGPIAERLGQKTCHLAPGNAGGGSVTGEYECEARGLAFPDRKRRP